MKCRDYIGFNRIRPVLPSPLDPATPKKGFIRPRESYEKRAKSYENT